MIYLKSPYEIKEIEYVNKMGVEVLQMCYEYLKPGVKARALDDIVIRYCVENGSLPAFKKYKGFPHNICVSINEEVIHGFPDDRIIKDGDIVSVDVGLKRNGYYSDSAFTKIIGEVPKKITELVRTTYECLQRGIQKAVPGNRIYDISAAIQLHAEGMGFDVIRDYVGHGVGLDLHEDPKIPNYISHGINWKLRPGMVIAIEPILVEGTYHTYVADNNWTVVTKDHKLAAHFEHSVAITTSGSKILSGGNDYGVKRIY